MPRPQSKCDNISTSYKARIMHVLYVYVHMDNCNWITSVDPTPFLCMPIPHNV